MNHETMINLYLASLLLLSALFGALSLKHQAGFNYRMRKTLHMLLYLGVPMLIGTITLGIINQTPIMTIITQNMIGLLCIMSMHIIAAVHYVVIKVRSIHRKINKNYPVHNKSGHT